MIKNIIKPLVNNLAICEKEFCTSLVKIKSLENNLGCVDGKIIGTGQPDYTKKSTEYEVRIKNKEFLLIDMPGIEGNESEYKSTIEDSLLKAHIIFYVNGSEKKPEKNTLEKLKKYMHDRTSVYALFNVHCKAKKNRDEEFDKTYEEELTEAYENHEEIINKTETILKSFLNENFKGSVYLNGLLAFCSFAVNNHGDSTIVDGENKMLRTEQSKFLKEYLNDTKKMQIDSRIKLVQNIIEDKVEHFEEYIKEENLRKLKNRLQAILSAVKRLQKHHKSKIKNFMHDYDEFEKQCETARDDFFHSISRIGKKEIEPAFFNVQEALFSEIELKAGKIKKKDVTHIWEQHEEQIYNDIKTAINSKINEAADAYKESISDAQKRLKKDLEIEQSKYEIAIQNDSILLDISFIKDLKPTAKHAFQGLYKIGSYTVTGVIIGTKLSLIGSIIAGIAGCLLGIVQSVWGFAASKEERINKAKEKAKKTIDEKIDCILNSLKEEFKSLDLEEQIDRNHCEIQKDINQQRKALNNVSLLLDSVVMSLKTINKKTGENDYE